MDIMKYLISEGVPTVAREKKPAPVKTGELAKTIGGLAGGMAASSSTFGVGKSIEALHKSTKAKVFPKLVSKMGKFGNSWVGKGLAKGGAWGAGAGLAYGLADSLAFGGGALLGRGLAGAGQKIKNMFKKPKMEFKIKSE